MCVLVRSEIRSDSNTKMAALHYTTPGLGDNETDIKFTVEKKYVLREAFVFVVLILHFHATLTILYRYVGVKRLYYILHCFVEETIIKQD